jgi:D-alanyl-D-alanine carboxypeptidase/D-alanyl-D-alanine-endopeptidase (penicillin-binding protein 4)
MKIKYTLILVCGLLLTACRVQKIASVAEQTVLSDSLLASAHVGICVYNATDNKYLYNYQGNKYFIPASNTKIVTCYAAMKYLGDSLVGLRYNLTKEGILYIKPAGDPTFLHPDFKVQPVYDFLSSFKKIVIVKPFFEDRFIGKGWSWDDYKDDYMVQRNNLPIYGNVIRLQKTETGIRVSPGNFAYFIPEGVSIKNGFNVNKEWDQNNLIITAGANKYLEVPFKPNASENWAMLHDTLHADVVPELNNGANDICTSVIHSQPTDSLLKIMMHRSDNFYAEQSLLMVGNEKLGVMNDAAIIDTLLNTDYAGLPQRPQWVDGSGLSRYNLFTPQDFVFILNKMRNEFAWNRITTIFSTGGDGTLGSYYKNLKGRIFAKTGSLSNNIALSGYLITPKNKTLIFSVLVNNHNVSSASVRKAVERFLTAVQREN